MIAGSGRRGGHSRRGAKAQTPVEEKELESGDRKNRKPEIEHYIPKKVQEKSELDEKGKPPDEGQKGNFQDGGGGGPGTHLSVVPPLGGQQKTILGSVHQAGGGKLATDN